jgi:predicted nucleic acid-binding protein
MRDVLHYLRTDHETQLIAAANHGSLRLLVPSEVIGEVDYYLADITTRAGLDGAAAEIIWDRIYCPRIREVDLTGIALSDARLNAVALRDPNDLPAATLTLLVAPSILLTADKDLGVISDANWAAVRKAAKTTQAGDAVVTGATLIGGAGIQLTGKVIDLAVRAPKVAAVAAAVTAGAIGAAHVVFPEQTARAKSAVRDTLRRAGKSAAEFAAHVLEGHAAEVADLSSAMVAPIDDAPIECLLAHLLSCMHARPTAGDLAGLVNAVRPDAPALDTRPILQLLRRIPAFVEGPSGYWRLGTSVPLPPDQAGDTQQRDCDGL